MKVNKETMLPGTKLLIEVTVENCIPTGDSDNSHGWTIDSYRQVYVKSSSDLWSNGRGGQYMWVAPEDIKQVLVVREEWEKIDGDE